MSLRILQTPIALTTVIVALLFLNACETTTSRPIDTLSVEQLAERAYAAGDYGKAADYWQQAISTVSAQDVDTMQLNTADARLKNLQAERAAELLGQINQQALTQVERARFYILNADLALQQNELERADFYLQAAAQDLPSNLTDQYRQVQQTLFNLQKAPWHRSLLEIAELSAAVTSYQPDQVLEVLRSLESVPSGQLMLLIEQQQYDPEFTEWLDLTLQVRSLLVSDNSISKTATNWANYHYGHMITESSFQDLVNHYRAVFPVPSKVAVLLPAEGGLSSAARAIRDGMLSAFLDQPGGSDLRFYPSGETSETAIAAYMQALDDGAVQIVGPLRLDSTLALAGLEQLTTPVLLLNESSSGMSENSNTVTVVNSLLLSQTEEAGSIANRVLAQGFKRALVIVPDNSWGSRVETAFTRAFGQGGGLVTAISRFNAAEVEHSDMLTRLLKIDESKQRRTDLQSWLGVPLNFEPSRRADFDFIFLAARPAEGRELKPLLRFHDVGDVPVYAMGRVYSGKPEAASDHDLNGIVFPTTRWQIQTVQTDIEIPASARGGAFGNFYALGQDAWRVLPWLPLLQKDPDLWFHGSIGALRLMPDGHLLREPAWAQFSAGQPVPYEWPDPN